MDIYVSSSGVWKKVTDVFVSSGGVWKRINSGWVSSSGVWKKFFPGSVSPSIDSTVTISRNNATYPSTLTGTNYHWNDATSLTYIFQKSSDNTSWTDIGTAATIANPSSGSSNTKTYDLTIADMPAYTSYYRFKVTATNSTYSTTTTSTSTSVSVNQPAPINNTAPSVTPGSGTAGTTTFSTTNGSWYPDDSDGIYGYQWQFYDGGSSYPPISGATSSSYSPGSNYVTLYGNKLRCKVTATNASGSTDAISNEVTVNPPSATAPTSGSATASDPAVITISWSGATNATKYRIFWNTTGNNPPGSASIYYDFNDTASPYVWSSAGADTTYYFFVAASGDDNVWSSWYGPFSATTPALPNISQIVSRNGGTSGTYNMQWTITSTNTSSYGITVYYGATTPPTTTFSNTVSSTVIQSNLGNDNNDYYYLVITPYYGASGTGSAGTTRTTSIKRNTATPTNLTNSY